MRLLDAIEPVPAIEPCERNAKRIKSRPDDRVMEEDLPCNRPEMGTPACHVGLTFLETDASKQRTLAAEKQDASEYKNDQCPCGRKNEDISLAEARPLVIVTAAPPSDKTCECREC